MANKKTKFRQSISIKAKLEILAQVDKKVNTLSEIASSFGCSKSTISDIIKNREKFQSTSIATYRKKVRSGLHPNLEQALLKWLLHMRSLNVSINGTLLKEKALTFADKLKIENFSSTDGWLDRFKARHNIKFRNICGEKNDVDTCASDEWIQQIPAITHGYHPRDIFNLDETALFYKLTPSKTLAFRNENCSGGKLSKERVTLMVGGNCDGSEKLPLLMIGKYKNPRCFKNVKTFPVLYSSNKNAWTTKYEWENYLKKMDKIFDQKKRSVLFIADNCSSHSKINLKAIKLVFLPPNSTAITQPMDQGVIKNIKHHYRHFLMKKLLDYVEDGSNNPKQFKINILDAMNMISKAWSKVKYTTIQNCFKKAGFGSLFNSQDDEFDMSDSGKYALLLIMQYYFINLILFRIELLSEDDIPLRQLQILWDSSSTGIDINLEYFITIDNCVATSAANVEDDIINSISSSNNETEIDLISDDDMVEEDVSPLVTSKEALHAIQIVRTFLICNQDTEKCLEHLQLVENRIDTLDRLSHTKQTKIDNFFSKCLK